MAAALLIASGAATRVGVDAARYPVEPRETAQRALELSLDRGTDDAGVRAMLTELRTQLGRRPLDSGTRVVYAALLLNLGRQLSDSRAAAHHAARAADLSPVTVPIVRLAVLTLTRTGDRAAALARVRGMFDYDAPAAASLLAEIEPLVEPAELSHGLAETPDAWFAWAARLRGTGRLDEAYDRNVATQRRWPDHLPTLRFVVARAVDDGDWAAVARWLPADRELGAVAEAAPLLTYRARLKAFQGDVDGARRDIRLAQGLDPQANLIRILAGEAYEALGDVDDARREWQRALFHLPQDETGTRRNLLARLARLEDEHGRASVALKLWQSILELDPSHTEAQRRVQALLPFDR